MRTRFLPGLFVAMISSAAAADPHATMHAVRYHEQGPPAVLKFEEAPLPAPEQGELLVRVVAAGVNPVDAKVRSGMFGKGGPLPAIPGYDVSGVIERVGAGVTRFKAGDEVFAYLSLQRGGGYAEYAIVKEGEAAPKPRSLKHDHAAAVPLAALTAWQALMGAADLDAGQSVLIHGGSGGVGSFAVQIARARGAKVYATASTANQKLLKDLGVDVPIDYTTQKFEDIVKEVDVVLDSVGGETRDRSFGVLKKNGILVSIVGMPDKARAEEAGVRATGILVKPNASELELIGSMIDNGMIKPEVSSVMPLEEARSAHEQIETGHTRGKIVLRVAPEPGEGAPR